MSADDKGKLHRVVRLVGGGDQLLGYMIECPGCALNTAPGASQHHVIWVGEANGQRATWSFNGDMEHPTFSPSVRVSWEEGEDRKSRCCHFFVRGGWIEFCADSTHALAGQTVPLREW
jgi:hypothetical protein